MSKSLNHRNWFYLLLLASLSGIAVATISPFNFIIPKHLSFDNIIEQFYYATNIKDYVRNILLFMPLGISLAGSIPSKKYQLWQILTAILLISAILSSNIELIQILLPSRASSLSDIVCNSMGGGLGAIVYLWRRDIVNLILGISTNNYDQINIKFLIIVIFSYCTSVSLGIWLLLSNINLSNWDDNYHLAVGSEVSGKVFWHGYVTSLYICDRSLNNQEVIQAFDHTHTFFSQLPNLITSLVFTEYQKNYQDDSQQIPDLLWNKEASLPKLSHRLNKTEKNSTIDEQIHHQKTVLFKHKNSLVSQKPVLNLNQKIKKSHQFTINIIAASDRLKQVGPARIISLAGNISHRNLMLGQEGKDFIFRLRTPTTGESAAQPEFIIPNLFDDYDLHQILIIFTQRKLTIYVDQPNDPYTFEFQPSTNFKLYLPWISKQWRVNLKEFNLLSSQLTFYGIILLPLSILTNTLISCYAFKHFKH